MTIPKTIEEVTQEHIDFVATEILGLEIEKVCLDGIFHWYVYLDDGGTRLMYSDQFKPFSDIQDAWMVIEKWYEEWSGWDRNRYLEVKKNLEILWLYTSYQAAFTATTTIMKAYLEG